MARERKMELPHRRYSVPETVMRKYWMSKEAEGKRMVDKCAQTEWRPCVVWAESSSGTCSRSASEPSLVCGPTGPVRPASAPSTPSWTTLPPTTSTSHSTDLPSPRPPPSVRVLCFHHDVARADAELQVPEQGPPGSLDAGTNTQEGREAGVQTCSEPDLSKACQTSPPPAPPCSPPPGHSHASSQTLVRPSLVERFKSRDLAKTSVSASTYKQFPTDMIIPRYSAVPRTCSMVVNTSSLDYTSDSESLTDSLEDASEPPRTSWASKLDNRLTRGEVVQQAKPQKAYISSRNTYAYFLFLSGEEDSIKEYKLPERVKARLRKREAEIKQMFGEKFRKVPKYVYTKRKRIVKANPHEIINISPSKSFRDFSSPAASSKKNSRSESHPVCHCTLSQREKAKSLKTAENTVKPSLNRSNSQIEQSSEIPSQPTEKPKVENASTSQISLTLTVPNRSSMNKDLTIDEKVAKVLLESLEEIRDTNRPTKRTVYESQENPFEELEPKTNVAPPNNHFSGHMKAQDMPSASFDSHANHNFIREEVEVVHPIRQVREDPPSRFPVAFSRSSAAEKPFERHFDRGESSYIIEEHTPRSFNTPREIFKLGKSGEPPKTSSHPYTRNNNAKSRYEPTSGYSSVDITSSQAKEQVEEEELLRAILKKSMQTQRNRNKGDGSHSEVCELGLKYLSNEIDIDQFIAGIPLERIEQDVKKLMYKHFLGAGPSNRDDSVPLDSVLNKKMVVSFIDLERERKDSQNNKNICDCTKETSHRAESTNTCLEPKKSFASSQTEDTEIEINKVLKANITNNNCSDEEPEKFEKCVSPMDKSIATAVQTIDSFLDSERLPPTPDLNENIFEPTSSMKNEQECCVHETRTVESEICFIDCGTSPCYCKKSNNASISRFINQGTEMTPEGIPNNHSSMSQHSFYSPRPVKTCIRNDLYCKEKRSYDESEGQTRREVSVQVNDFYNPMNKKKETTKELIHSSKNYNEVMPSRQQKLYTESRIPEEKYKSAKIISDIKPEKKLTSKSTSSKKGPSQGSKFTQMFEVIPEERLSPVEGQRSYRSAEPTRRSKVQPEQLRYDAPSRSFFASQDQDFSYTKSSRDEHEQHKSRRKEHAEEFAKRDDFKKTDSGARYSKSQTKVAEKPYEDKPSKGKSLREEPIDEISKPILVGRFRPVPEKQVDEPVKPKRQSVKLQGKMKGQGERQMQIEAGEDALNLSKGWINFYLLPEDKTLADQGGRRAGRRSSSDGSVSLPEIMPRVGSPTSSPASSPDQPPQRRLPHVNSPQRYHPSVLTSRRSLDVDKPVEQSVTSSGGVTSESRQEEGRLPGPRSRRPSKSSSTHTGGPTSWTVTVAGGGGGAPPPDVEMRLSFGGGREESSSRYQPAGSATTRPHLLEGERKATRLQEGGLADTVPSRRERAANSRTAQARLCSDTDDSRSHIRKVVGEGDWGSEATGSSEGELQVVGAAITPEEKPRVATQSERDLVRPHRYHRFTR